MSLTKLSRVITLLSVLVCAMFALAGSASAIPVLAGVKCNWTGCIADASPETTLTESGTLDGYGCNVMTNNNGASVAMFCDDEIPNISTVVYNECELWKYYGPGVRRLIVVGSNMFNPDNLQCPAGDQPYAWVVNAHEWYPYESASPGAGATLATSITGGCGNFGSYIVQYAFGWPAYQGPAPHSWNSAAPGLGGAWNENVAMDQSCHAFTYSHGFWDGTSTSGVEGRF